MSRWPPYKEGEPKIVDLFTPATDRIMAGIHLAGLVMFDRCFLPNFTPSRGTRVFFLPNIRC